MTLKKIMMGKKLCTSTSERLAKYIPNLIRKFLVQIILSILALDSASNVEWTGEIARLKRRNKDNQYEEYCFAVIYFIEHYLAIWYISQTQMYLCLSSLLSNTYKWKEVLEAQPSEKSVGCASFCVLIEKLRNFSKHPAKRPPLFRVSRRAFWKSERIFQITLPKSQKISQLISRRGA